MSLQLVALVAATCLLLTQAAPADRIGTPSKEARIAGGYGGDYGGPPDRFPWLKDENKREDQPWCQNTDCPGIPVAFEWNLERCGGDKSGLDCSANGNLCAPPWSPPSVPCSGKCSNGAWCQGKFFNAASAGSTGGLCLTACCPLTYTGAGMLRIQAKSCDSATCESRDDLYLLAGQHPYTGWNTGSPRVLSNVKSIDFTTSCYPATSNADVRNCWAVCENEGIIDLSSVKATFTPTSVPIAAFSQSGYFGFPTRQAGRQGDDAGSAAQRMAGPPATGNA